MSANEIYAELRETIWNEKLESSFPYRRFRGDMQGWNSHHPYLIESIEKLRPKIVIEIGVWKGGSSIHMAKYMKDNNFNSAIIAIDTWLGSWEHWEQPEFFKDLLFSHGYPSLYNTFMTNVCENNVQDFILPLPLDSANAFFVLQRKGIYADLIHIDGGHDFQAVIDDMTRWWKVLRPGGMLIMDDYDVSGVVWPTVRDAVDAFRSSNPHNDFAAMPFKARLTKPL